MVMISESCDEQGQRERGWLSQVQDILFYENMDAKSKGLYAVASGWVELDNDNPIDALCMFV